MSMNRREFIVAGLATAALAGCQVDKKGTTLTLGEVAEASPPVDETEPNDKGTQTTPVATGEHTTLRRTIVLGEPVNEQGYCQLAYGPGEPHLLRTDLGIEPAPAREERRRGLLSFVQFTDVHLVDAQSPARVEFLDRLSDGVAEDVLFLFKASYHPQEMLNAHVTDALVRAVNKVAKGPVSGMPFSFTICTGDNTDTCQHNEQRWFIDMLDGEPITPDSGAADKWEGVHDDNPTSYDIHYWHPHGTPDGALAGDDIYRKNLGFPTIPGLLEAARQRLDSTGLDMPWYTCYGNHDGLWQGNFPKGLSLLSGSPGSLLGDLLDGVLGDDNGLEQMLFTILATGNLKITSLPTGISPDDVANFVRNFDLQGLLTAILSSGAGVRLVTPDSNRRLISRKQIIEEHFNTAKAPIGHGFTQHNRDANLAYYAFDLPGAEEPMRGIVLDTVNPNGFSEGSIDPAQLAWLEQELTLASRRYLSTAGDWVEGVGEDKLIVIFSHHTIDSMINPLVATGGNADIRILGDQVRDLLLRFPNVILWVNGHTHHNKVLAHTRSGMVAGGFWEVNTASHIDWPQQVRLLEIVDNADQTLSIFGTIVDADAPLVWDGDLTSPGALAAISREIAANDPQNHAAHRDDEADVGRGVSEDRNVELVVAHPYYL